MNRFTLTYTNSEQELRYNAYIFKQVKVRIQQYIIMSCIVCLLQGIDWLINYNFILSSIAAGWFIGQIIGFAFIQKNDQYIKYIAPTMTFVAFILPYALYFIVITRDNMDQTQKYLMIWLNSLTVYFMQVQQNFAVNMIVQYNLVILNALSFYYLLGYNYLIIVYVIYSLGWIPIEYEKYCERRLLFQESQINQSISDIIDNTVRDNLVVFTYDDINIKYVMEICNQAARQYLQTQNITEILNNLFVFVNEKSICLGDYINNKYIRKQKYIDSDTVQDGYYQSKQNKLKIHIFIQYLPKFKAIINLETLSNKIHFTNNQIQFMSKHQILAIKTLNSISSFFIRYTSSQGQQQQSIINILEKYHMRVKLLSIRHSYTYKLSIDCRDILIQLQAYLSSIPNLSYHIIAREHQIYINQDFSLTLLLMQLIIKFYMKVQVYPQNRLLVSVKIINEDSIEFKIKYQEPPRSPCNKRKLLNMIYPILKIIGNDNSLTLSDWNLKYLLISDLQQPFAIRRNDYNESYSRQI